MSDGEQETIDLVQPGDGWYFGGLAVAFIVGPAVTAFSARPLMNWAAGTPYPFLLYLVIVCIPLCMGMMVGANMCQHGRNKKYRIRRNERQNGA